MRAPTMLRQSTVLVTGGAGFIGRAVCAALLGRGERVRIVDVLATPRQRRAVASLPGAEVVAGDLSTTPLRELLVDVDAIVHLAGLAGVQPSWGGGFDEYLRHNVGVTGRLLDAAGQRRIVVASSSSVYGDVPAGAVTEDAPLRPLSPYGVSKAAAELLVQTYVARGADAVALRLFSVYGRHQRPDMALARILDAVATGRPFPMRGDGSQRRDLTHVDDVVTAILGALDAPNAPGTVLNVGSGRPVALADLVGEVERQTGAAVPVRVAPIAPGDPARTCADVTRASTLLGWQPRVALGAGVADQIATHPGLGATEANIA